MGVPLKWARLGLPGRSSPEYRAHRAAKQRCMNKRCRQYPLYGGRGIRVCDEWLGPYGFAKFYAHVGARPSPSHSLDRINNDGNYEPGNVRWATQTEQCRNKRITAYVTWRGERRSLAEWAAITGVPRGVLWLRIARGWDIERTMTTPPISKDAQRRAGGVWA